MAKNDKVIENLRNAKDNEALLESLTKLQNEIAVYHNVKVIAITTINNDPLAAAFAKAFAETFSRNGETSLVVDANLYNPCLQDFVGDGVEAKNRITASIDNKANAIIMAKEIYPGESYKGKAVDEIIKENEGNYDHFIVLVPSVKEHKDVALLKDIVDGIILLTRKNKTTKKSIFEAIQFFRVHELPLAKTVVLA